MEDANILANRVFVELDKQSCPGHWLTKAYEAVIASAGNGGNALSSEIDKRLTLINAMKRAGIDLLLESWWTDAERDSIKNALAID